MVEGVSSISFTDRTLWKQSTVNFQDVALSYNDVNPTIIGLPVSLPSGKSFSLTHSVCIGTKANINDHLVLVLLYSPKRPSIIVCNASPIQLSFSSPVLSFGFDMEPLSFGQYLMEIMLSDGTLIKQTTLLNEDAPSGRVPMFFGYSSDSRLISGFKLTSYNSSKFALSNMVEGSDLSPTSTSSSDNALTMSSVIAIVITLIIAAFVIAIISFFLCRRGVNSNTHENVHTEKIYFNSDNDNSFRRNSDNPAFDQSREIIVTPRGLSSPPLLPANQSPGKIILTPRDSSSKPLFSLSDRFP
jgi:hypothetical protein